MSDSVTLIATTTIPDLPGHGFVKKGYKIQVTKEEAEDMVGDLIHSVTKKVVGRKPFEYLEKGLKVIAEDKAGLEGMMRSGLGTDAVITEDPAEIASIQTEKKAEKPKRTYNRKG